MRIESCLSYTWKDGASISLSDRSGFGHLACSRGRVRWRWYRNRELGVVAPPDENRAAVGVAAIFVLVLGDFVACMLW